MIQRNFYPGDKWVFFKIYTSPLSANNLLLENINPLITQWMDSKVIDKWFFIRYTDPDYHLRVRVEITDIEKLGRVISEMRTALAEGISGNLVFKIQIDTYQREIERYGELNMERCESFFHQDSDLIIDTINKTDKENDLLVISIIWLCELLSMIKMSDSEILDFVKEMSLRYRKEFNFSNEQIKIMNLKYREIRLKAVDGIKKLHAAPYETTANNHWIRSEDRNGSLLSSLIHMHMNRLFPVNQRVYEFMVYHMFDKAFDSVLKQTQ